MYTFSTEINQTTICWPKLLNYKINESFPRVIEIGYSKPIPGYRSDKLYRDVYVLHFVVSGKGSYYDMSVEGPCAFLEIPNTVHHYTVDASPDAPQWEQYWIMFSGSDVPRLMEEAEFPKQPTVFECKYISKVVSLLNKMQSSSSYVDCDDYFYMLSALLKIFSFQKASLEKKISNTSHSVYVQTICNHVQLNYANINTENELAQIVHLSARYMHRIFKQEMGITPMQYLIDTRIDHAKRLLLETELPISAVAQLVGFSNPTYFYTVFKKKSDGLTPLIYRKHKSVT